MVKICEEHVEWATVHRMREMLSSVPAEFQVTHTYSLFVSILCWTMQGLRPDEYENDKIARALRGCAGRIAEQPISRFVKVEPWEIDLSRSSDLGDTNKVFLNNFQDFRDPKTGDPFSAFRCLKALRNAVGHGDAKRVTPVNKGNKLIGYSFNCTEAHVNKEGSWIGTWSGRVCLDKRAMLNLGRELADQYCLAIAGDDAELEIKAGKIKERT